jgi:MYXO-CTERM domain-containing protein
VTACTYPGNTVQCRAAACANGVATIAAFCVNTGSCPAIQTQACAPFQCSGTQCGGDCVVDSNCATGSYCFGGICKLKADPGVACSAANQCKSGYCVDSVCCNSPCSGQCQACNEPNKLGTCSAVTGAPKGGRPACATDGTACGGTCNGVLTATCAYPSVQCRAPACSNDVATLAASCDGMGACPPMQTQACVPFKCSGTNCGGNCVLDSDCSGGSFCAAGVCLGKLPLGFGCGEDSHCLSGYCVDGVCCGGGCVGQCEACDNPGQQGTCLPVIGAPHGARPQCTNDGSVCSGTCNGSLTTGCAYPGAQSQCRAPACTNNVATIAAYCAGNGMCPAMQTQVCAPFLCEGTQCGGDCTIDSECASGHYCSAGVCKLMKEIGQPCGQPNECNSGYCADGYCCNEACSGQCEACDTQNALGVCAVVLGAPHGGKSACAGAGTCQGQCDGIDATTCAFPGMTVECSAASCQDSVQKSSANCDGVGSCQPAVTQSCGNFGCDGTVCKTECASPSDCKEGLVCVATQCVVPEGGLDAGADAVIDAQPDTQPLADAKPDTQDAAAGPDSPTDAADEQAVADDAAVAPVPVSEDAGGCGCSTPGSRTGAGGLAGVMLAAALAALRRRRTRRAA